LELKIQAQDDGGAGFESRPACGGRHQTKPDDQGGTSQSAYDAQGLESDWQSSASFSSPKNNEAGGLN
jgi:hypothetical protein